MIKQVQVLSHLTSFKTVTSSADGIQVSHQAIQVTLTKRQAPGQLKMSRQSFSSKSTIIGTGNSVRVRLGWKGHLGYDSRSVGVKWGDLKHSAIVFNYLNSIWQRNRRRRGRERAEGDERDEKTLRTEEGKETSTALD